jgi:hypothetical protein
METLHCYKDIIHYCVFQVNYKPYSTREKKLNFYIPVHGVGGNNTYQQRHKLKDVMRCKNFLLCFLC